ncbi:sugar phosphate nucleotidyltransferase [Litoribrevibacter euphylliae]|uniref:Sugar phosphate nucleotidyltransferase n=1 Tax=Litoribrevibacter euphylliae TaxID=1834034 RepID=A0ABV7HGU5_9GAMM
MHDTKLDSNTISSAVLLAAGCGTRLQPLTLDAPKCLTPVAGETILYRLVQHLRLHGIKRLVVVIGYKGEQVRAYLEQHASDFELEFVVNHQYDSTNNIYSLWLAKQKIQEDFMLLESDLVFETAMLKDMLKPDRIAVSSPLPWMNGTMLEIDEQCHAKRFYLGKNLSTNRFFKTVNICSLSYISWQKILERLESYVANNELNGYYEVVFADLVAEGRLDFEVVEFRKNAWYEIDTLEDLDAANHLYGYDTDEPLVRHITASR